jgi:NADPH-dependent 2,4-dienoyl-CoA reductase/sulfur reductase-like enzyme
MNIAGAAAMGCIETLKKFGYSGEITIITRELTYPYDKT